MNATERFKYVFYEYVMVEADGQCMPTLDALNQRLRIRRADSRIPNVQQPSVPVCGIVGRMLCVGGWVPSAASRSLGHEDVAIAIHDMLQPSGVRSHSGETVDW